ncbi:MAG: WG repeat-containing protein [Rubrivivax sp.]|nr:WG repeat-containing protein [Pyrinomonadaceae bacterium]
MDRKWLYGFIDKTGKIVIEPQFVYQPRDFVDGLAKVMGQKNTGFIDQTGSFRITVEYEHSDDFFSEGLLAAVIQNEQPRGVYLKPDGQVALEIPFWQQRTAHQRSLYTIRRQQLAPFSEGLAPVLSFNKLGFIDRGGKVVITPLFRETNGFSEGLAAVKIIGSDGQYVWGYIDRTGEFAITPQFSDAKPFAGGLAQVTTADGKSRLIDRSGKVIWQLSK